MTAPSNERDAAVLARLQQELAEAIDFLGHDVREGHSSTLALLELQRIKPDPMSLPDLVERVERNARRSLAAIDDFMDLARARTQPLRLEEIDLVDLLVEIVADAWSAARLRGVRVQVVDMPDSASGWADRELASAALAKLLRDVIAVAPGGVEVRCTLRLDEAHWLVEIEDPVGAAVGTDPAAQRRAPPGVALAGVVAERHAGTLRAEPGSGGQGRILRLQFSREISHAPPNT